MKKNRAALLMIICFFNSYSASLSAQNYGNSDLKGIGTEAFEYLRQFYDYDLAVPLNASIIEKLDAGNYNREKIVFDGVNHQVPSYLATPKKGVAPYPVVLLLHGLTSSKESWWDQNSMMWKLTEQLLANGYAVFTMDAEYHGERSVNNPFKNPEDLLNNGWFVHFRDMMSSSVIDFRRGMDYLATRKELDTSRTGVVGYSMGGIMTFVLSAVDKRLDVSIACVTPIITIPYFPMAVQNYAPYIRKEPFLMLMGKADERNYTIESANQLYNLLGSSEKQLIFYEGGHMLPDQWTLQAAEWMKRYL